MLRLKPAHEAFCRAYAAYPNAAEAARSAGYSFESASQQGYRLLRRAFVVRRVAELRAEMVERECGTPTALLAKLETTFRAALHKDQPIAAARVVEAQAKLSGHSVKAMPAVPAEALHEIAQLRDALAHMAKQLGLATPGLAKPA